jgi:hypothetical protein
MVKKDPDKSLSEVDMVYGVCKRILAQFLGALQSLQKVFMLENPRRQPGFMPGHGRDRIGSRRK